MANKNDDQEMEIDDTKIGLRNYSAPASLLSVDIDESFDPLAKTSKVESDYHKRRLDRHPSPEATSYKDRMLNIELERENIRKTEAEKQDKRDGKRPVEHDPVFLINLDSYSCCPC